MQKTFIILGATLIAAATIQTAAANDRRHVRKAQPVPAPHHPVGARLQRRALAVAADRARLVALFQRRDVCTSGTVMPEA